MVAVVVLGGAAFYAYTQIARSSYLTGRYLEKQQPVQFSHKHHVGDDGIDCSANALQPCRALPSARILLQPCARPQRGREGCFTERPMVPLHSRLCFRRREGLPGGIAWRVRAQEVPRDDGIGCRCPPAEQRAPFVHGCVPANTDPSHDTGRVRLLMQRQVSTPTGHLQPAGGNSCQQPERLNGFRRLDLPN